MSRYSPEVTKDESRPMSLIHTKYIFIKALRGTVCERVENVYCIKMEPLR